MRWLVGTVSSDRRAGWAAGILRFGLSLLLCGLFSLHLLKIYELPLLQRLDYIFYDLRLQVGLEQSQEQRLVILDIDEKSLAAEGRWPWSREKLSYLVDMLFDYYAIKLLAFDMVFSEPDQSINIEEAENLLKRLILQQTPETEALQQLRTELASDARFAASVEGRPVILGFFFSGRAENSPGVLPATAIAADDLPFAGWLPQAHSFGGNLVELQRAATTGGFINTPYPDQDGVLRSVPLLIRFQDKVYESLSLAVLRQLFPVPPEFRLAEYGHAKDARLEAIRLAGKAIPVNQSASILIPFVGGEQVFRYISATDVLNGQVDPSELEDRIVLVGASAAGLSDFYPTPLNTNTPGVEIHANIIRAFLDQKFYSAPSFLLSWEILQLWALGLLVALLFPRLDLLGMVLASSLLLALLLGVNLLLWQQLQIAVSLASPLVLLSFLIGTQMAFGYLLEIRRKRQLGHIFGRYVPPQLVDQMSRSGENFSIGGISRELTVLFSDIRGFTSLSETLDPEQLVHLINRIFNELTQEIHATQGTIDKYMGDAVMAFWGAPLPDEDQAEHAILAGLAMIRAIERLNQQFIAEGRSEIHIGVGINTGVMSVGNMGSDFRMAYTVMGDAVNLGSRLEGLTKSYGVYIIVSEFTKTAAPGFLYRELDRVRVKGKLEPIAIHQPLCQSDQATAELQAQVEQSDQALNAYRAMDWDEASNIFATLARQYPTDNFYKTYLQRIDHYRLTPPPEDWGGVFVHQSK